MCTPNAPSALFLFHQTHLLHYLMPVLITCRDGYKVLIIGGGAAGITTASHYARKLPSHEVAVIEVCQLLKPYSY
jgi:hypothetical protein